MCNRSEREETRTFCTPNRETCRSVKSIRAKGIKNTVKFIILLYRCPKQ